MIMRIIQQKSKPLYKALKALNGRRLVAVYQPHRYSRTKDCLGLYKGIFDHADEVLSLKFIQLAKRQSQM